MTSENFQELLEHAERCLSAFDYSTAREVLSPLEHAITPQKRDHDHDVLEKTDPTTSSPHNSRLLARLAFILGSCDVAQDQPEEASTRLKTALGHLDQEPDHMLRLRVLNALAQAYRRLTHFDEAHAAITEVLALCDEAEKNTEMAEELARAVLKQRAMALSAAGNIAFNKADYSEALEYFFKTQAINEQIDNKSHIAATIVNIANVYHMQGDYTRVIEHYHQALTMDEELGDKRGVATDLGNIGMAYMHMADYPKALEYHHRALAINEELGNKRSIAIRLGNIGTTYTYLADYPRALEFLTRALALYQDMDQQAGVATVYGSIAAVYLQLNEWDRALDYYRWALAIHEQLGDKHGIATEMGNIGGVYMLQEDYDRALSYFTKARNLSTDIGSRRNTGHWLQAIAQVQRKRGNVEAAHEGFQNVLRLYRDELKTNEGVSTALAELGLIAIERGDRLMARSYFEQALELAHEIGEKETEAGAHRELAELYAAESQGMEAYAHFKDFHRLNEEVRSEEARRRAEHVEHMRAVAEREKEIAIANAAATAELNATTHVLHRVLPPSIAGRLVAGEKEIADHYASVSILFADIVGFTPISAAMPPYIVVRLLNYVFHTFDAILKRHGCEKIKTIGDGYMAVAGAPLSCDDHAERLAAAAMEMIELRTVPENIQDFFPPDRELAVRIGIHSGSVVAGVIGDERFVYDIYSDAVNTAARMESHGQARRVHCSQDFVDLMQRRQEINPTARRFSFDDHGVIEVKGKGAMHTYFLRELHP